MHRLNIGIAGLGTVAQGLLNAIDRNRTHYESQGIDIQVVRVASRTPKPEVDLLGAEFTTDLIDLIEDGNVDVVVELIGSPEPAKDLIHQALERGKHVVTGNKAVLAKWGRELRVRARASDVQLRYEAAVAGGIPVILGIKAGLAGNQISAIVGIINGTCNYILTQMRDHGRDFAAVLKDAQELGYAEADPTLDVSGMDATQKLAVLITEAFGLECTDDDIFTEGVESISIDDLQYANELGFEIKHLSIAQFDGSAFSAASFPALVPNSHLLSKIAGVQNAVQITGDAVTDVTLVGPGAGAGPTASSVLSDLIAIPRQQSNVSASNNVSRAPDSYREVVRQHYLNIPALDTPGVIASIGEVLSRHGVSIESVIQKHGDVRGESERTWVPVVILTDAVAESRIETVISELDASDLIAGKSQHIRVADFLV